MSRYIDADALVNRINIQRKHLKPKEDSRDLIGDSAYKIVIEIINRQPTADVVEVVRCKDCTRQMICFHSDDYFCADGERREDDKG